MAITPAYPVYAQKQTRVEPLRASYYGGQDTTRERPEAYDNYGRVFEDIVWVFRAVSAVAQDLASLPLHVVRGPEGKEERVEDSELGRLLRFVNKQDDRYMLIEKTGVFAQLTGNSYWGLERGDRTSKPAQIWPLRPDRVKVEPDPKEHIGGYVYEVEDKKVHYDRQDMVHIRLCHPTNDHYGLGPLQPATVPVILQYSIELYNRMVFQRWGAPAMALKTTRATISRAEEASMKRDFEERFQGTAKAGKLVVLREGYSLEGIGLTPDDLHSDAAEKRSCEKILGAFGVPPIRVGLYEGVNFATADEQIAQYWENTVIAFGRRVESAIDEQLAPQFEKGLRVRFDTSGIAALQPDRAKEAEWVRGLVSDALITRNEARAVLRNIIDLGPDFPPEVGDAVFLPLNLVPAAQVASEEPEVEEGEEKLFRDAADLGDGNGRPEDTKRLARELVDGMDEVAPWWTRSPQAPAS